MTVKDLHQKAFVLDSHCDTPLSLILGTDPGKKNKIRQVDFIRMKEGGVDASFFAIYTSNSLSPDQATRRALQLIAQTYDAIEKNPDKVSLATTVREGRALKANGMTAIYLGMENGSPIQKDLSLLRLFYRMGVRYMTLTHAGNNEICDSCAPKEKRWNGVSPFGREVIAQMNRLGMMIDVSHISDEAFYDVLKYSKAPVVATHSCCRALANHPRNMTDQMIKDLAAAGGVIQINFYPSFLDDTYGARSAALLDAYDEAEEVFKANPKSRKALAAFNKAELDLVNSPRPPYQLVVDHIEHVIKLVGVNHVGIGSDFDGIAATPQGLEHVGKMQVITGELMRRGYQEEEICKILGENFLRVFTAAENLALR